MLKKQAGPLLGRRRAYYLSPRPRFKLLYDLPNKVPAWKRDYFVVRSAMGWPFPTEWGLVVLDPDATLDEETVKGLQDWARLGLKCEVYLTEAKLIQTGLSSGVMEAEKTRGVNLFDGMRRKRAAKRVRADASRVAEPEALRMEPPREPEVAPPFQEAAWVPYAETAYTRVVPSGSGSQDEVGSVLTPSYTLRKSKKATCPEEVTALADLPTNLIGARAASHAMVVSRSSVFFYRADLFSFWQVNSSIHALAIQAERVLKRAQASEVASRVVRAKLMRSWRDKEALGMVVRHMADLRLDLEHQVEYLQDDIGRRQRSFLRPSRRRR
ncbi:PREDICTED: uncharacterized protein LOC109115659 [Nelumbo nucifera]|uniref:Uncharacterized protein LOC109115659 n=1 Tax=Nelumbo nucifera TaxID=4432 RepID=A0A1U8QBD7_NELNU|nr:PREDICTED: uncharacterized protein LOC109115659 [Nelumbo nucifera]